ncbi:DJ-1/PfpI family protein [Caldalkalibacillus mannanilyticus]|uniref:DJ-1/PfpI family protein n=1 Tax=Caldalkalibacillus mannanilyticus TaxID=1418 RepID=UPI000685FB4A|nr:DJ-1/PfpI family protein [Caldalkalibacillus mannanilyticus]
MPTEVIDFLAPYELFASTQKFNVFAVAPEKRAATLTGGLDLMPHFTFAELDTLLASSSEVIVIPAIFNMEHENYQAISDYIQKHSSDQTILLSICAGAGNLAETGLLYDKKATSHWGDVILFEKKYPEVHWVRDQRYVVEAPSFLPPDYLLELMRHSMLFLN